MAGGEVELKRYMVVIWPRYDGARRDIEVEAPDAFSARKKALELFPDDFVFRISRLDP
jgi:hypothetical protein